MLELLHNEELDWRFAGVRSRLAEASLDIALEFGGLVLRYSQDSNGRLDTRGIQHFLITLE
jgi:hypothetical protein